MIMCYFLLAVTLVSRRTLPFVCFVGGIPVGSLNIIGAVFSLGLGNAGVDHPGLHYGFVNEMPSSIDELAQVIGRFSRRPTSSVKTDVVDILCNLDGYLSMLRQIHYTKVATKKNQNNINKSELLAKSDLLSVLRILVLMRGCFHARLANLCSQPGLDKLSPFWMMCPACHVCTQDWDKLFPRVNYRSLCNVLASECITTLSTDRDVNKIMEKEGYIEIALSKFGFKRQEISSLLYFSPASGLWCDCDNIFSR